MLLTLIATCVVAYFAWRISETLPDLVFRLSEIQRDLADIRRQLGQNSSDNNP